MEFALNATQRNANILRNKKSVFACFFFATASAATALAAACGVLRANGNDFYFSATRIRPIIAAFTFNQWQRAAKRRGSLRKKSAQDDAALRNVALRYVVLRPVHTGDYSHRHGGFYGQIC